MRTLSRNTIKKYKKEYLQHKGDGKLILKYQYSEIVKIPKIDEIKKQRITDFWHDNPLIMM